MQFENESSPAWINFGPGLRTKLRMSNSIAFIRARLLPGRSVGRASTNSPTKFAGPKTMSILRATSPNRRIPTEHSFRLIAWCRRFSSHAPRKNFGDDEHSDLAHSDAGCVAALRVRSG